VKYQIDGLRDLAASKYKHVVTTCWNHEDFAHSVHVAFTSTVEEVTQLREIISDILHQHFDDLKDKAEIETVVCNIPRLAFALLKRSRAKGKDGMETEEQSGSPVSPEVDRECTQCGADLISRTVGKGGRPKRIYWYCPDDCW